MRRHQILTGAVNLGNHCFSVGSVASFTFWAYGSGCDLVILGVDLQPIHVIPGHLRGYKLISCLDCCQFCGKIAVSYGQSVVIYHPKLVQSKTGDIPVFTWVEECTLNLTEENGHATVLSWASTGERLLIGCKEILLWGAKKKPIIPAKRSQLKVHFSIDETIEEDDDENQETSDDVPSPELEWELLWHSGMEENLAEVQFSPDDELFASVAHGDTMIKVWHQRYSLPAEIFTPIDEKQKHASSHSSHSWSEYHWDNIKPVQPDSSVDFTFTYLFHPKPVVSFSWRKGVPLLPSGSVPNILISSCLDNMCRVWCETLTPPMDVAKLAMIRGTTHAHPVVSGKKHFATPSDKGASVKKSISAPVMKQEPEKSRVFPNIDKPAARMFRHFHIAATINPTSDIPLLPSMSAFENESEDNSTELQPRVFTVHWLDNKYHHAMSHLNKILHETMSETRDLEREVNEDREEQQESETDEVTPAVPLPTINKSSPLKRPSGFSGKFPVWDSADPESVDSYLSCLASPVSPEIQSNLGLSLPVTVYDLLRKAWLDQSDALFAIHPTDGSLLVWHISYLDENRCGQIRQPQVSFSSRIPMAIPSCDASTMCSKLVLYANHYSAHLAFNICTGSQTPLKNPENDTLEPESNSTSTVHPSPTVSLLSKHSDGSLNHWDIAFSPTAGYSTVTSITHKSRFCGHRYHLSGIFCHPTLPLLLTTSRHKLTETKHNGKKENRQNIHREDKGIESELILWRVDPVGTLCHSGGVTELARLNGPKFDDFNEVAWFPVLFPSWCLGYSSTSPSSCFLSKRGNTLLLYQSVIDAEQLLDDTDFTSQRGSNKQGKIASQQSSSRPGCLLLLDDIKLDDREIGDEILLFSIFPENGSLPSAQEDETIKRKYLKRGHGIDETFYVVMVMTSDSQNRQNGSDIVIKTLKISFSANMNVVTGAKSRRNTVVISDSSDNASEGDSNTTDSEQPQEHKLSYLNVAFEDLGSQTITNPVGPRVIMASPVSDPFSLCVLSHAQTLPMAILFTTEDGKIFFWQGIKKPEMTKSNNSLEWHPWKSNSIIKSLQLSQPQIECIGKPLAVKMAHYCMLACLSEVTSDNRKLYYASIFECISSGGSLWQLQDQILAGTVDMPQGEATNASAAHMDWLSREDGTFLLTVNVGRNVKIYSQSPVGLQWEKIFEKEKENTSIGAASSTPLKSGGNSRPLLKRQSTLDIVTRQKLMGPHAANLQNAFGKSNNTKQPYQGSSHLLHWSLLSEIFIGNSVGLSAVHMDSLVTPKPQPVKVSWVRDGLLLVATETEMHVFCHWMEQAQDRNRSTSVSGVLHGSASLSRSTPEGLCQYVMQEPDVTGTSQIVSGAPVVSLMSVADLLCPSLPQYHPLVLSELTNGGHLYTVKHILINLARMMNGQLESVDSVVHDEPVKLRKFGLSTEEDVTEQKHIAPVLLCDLLDEDGHINNKPMSNPTIHEAKNATGTGHGVDHKSTEKTDYQDLFTTSDFDTEMEDDMEFLTIGQTKAKSPDAIDLNVFEPDYLGPEHCQVMHNYLARNLLPGLSSLDQMELMAIADTVANAVDTAAFQAADDKVTGIGASSGGRGYASSGHAATESMDQCGLRFVFAMHNHLCLLRFLPAQQRNKLLRRGLGSCNFAWAFHSDAEEEILSVIPSVQRGSPEWEELRSFGAAWWIRSTATLRRLIEQTARTAFQKDSNPLDAAVFYMALNKKNILKGLFKSVHDDRMMQFFSQNFSEDRWHRAALKNAFALMGKQRFQEATAFFLLANSVQDAVEVCIDKMKDLQLASVIVRLYDPELSAQWHSDFLRKHVLGQRVETSEDTPKRVHSDPFIRSMAFWALGSYENALKTLMENQKPEDDSLQDLPASITDIFNFYNFLRTHPLILRQRKIDQSHDVSSTKQQLDDKISEEERMLFFATAASHLDAGCPLLTLDVLSTLPPTHVEDTEIEDGKIEDLHDTQEEIQDQQSTPATAASLFDAADDWSTTPALNTSCGQTDELELEWSESEESVSDTEAATLPSVEITAPTPIKTETNPAPVHEDKERRHKTSCSDVYAHQLRLMACLKIFVSELKSLAMTNHTGNGEIRNQLYAWLEKETEVLKRISPILQAPDLDAAADGDVHVDTDVEDKSEFSSDSESDGEPRKIFRRTGDELSMSPGGTGNLNRVLSLHELYLAEKLDWKQRREMASRRRKWLRQYRRFLRALLSYCCLHDDVQGSLSPLRIELLLLLQDSLQEKTPQQLSSPVPNPTTIPLLSSSIVACRTVVADPTSRLSHMAQDILSALLSFPEPPPFHGLEGSQSPTIPLCRQAEALSSCLYQSISDAHSRTYRARILDSNRLTPENPLASGNSENQYVTPNTLPSQWPGVVSLQALLNTESGDNRPKIIVLLCEALVSVYISLLVHGLHTSNSLLLFRLISHSMNEKTWNAVFGGGAKLVVKYSKPVSGSPVKSNSSKVRDKFNHRILSYSLERRGSISSGNSADQASYREKFVAPETTLWDCLLSKPLMVFSGSDEVGFDSDGGMDTDSFDPSYSDDDSYDEFGDLKPDTEHKATEHGDPTSYSWHILRLAVVRTVLHNLKKFLPTAGLELSELGTSSPLLNSVLQMLAQWQLSLVNQLENFKEPPPNYIQGIHSSVPSPRGRPAMLKYKMMLDPNNTPFIGTNVQSLGARRLWHCLVRRENLQDMFIRYIFEKKPIEKKSQVEDRRSSIAASVTITSAHRDNTAPGKQQNVTKHTKSRRATIAVVSPNDGIVPSSGRFANLKYKENDEHLGKVKILHKETEIISSFCINNANPSCVVLSTNRDVQEIDVSNLLASDTWSWVEEDLSPTFLQKSDENQKSGSHKDEDFLMVSRKQSNYTGVQGQMAGMPSGVPWTGNTQTGQGATVLLKRSFSGVRRMSSHPSLPYYLTGHHDGSIRMWEWGHQQQISLFRAAGQFPKVTNLHFSSLGNKISVVDADGYLALWQVSSPKKPYLMHQCHDRSASDCCFMSSTSVLATCGLSTTNCNVAIWDTLLPPRSMLVKDFHVHEGVGASCVTYAPQQRTLVVGGRDGKVSIYDLRRPDDQLHVFVAHEASIKCVAIGPDERLFVTGSVVGDVRVWDTQSHLLAYNLAGEHARTSLFRNFGSGTMKVQIHNPGNRVFSCGADGTLKLRMLPYEAQDELSSTHSLGSRIQKLTLQRQVVKLAEAVRRQCLVY